jgi:glucokinase
MNKFAIGTDIGGSHISCAAIDLQSQSIINKSFVTREVDNQASAADIFANWAGAINESLASLPRSEVVGIGFAMPGPFDYANGIALFNANVAKYQNLYGINISHRLKDLLSLPGASSNFDFRYLNDATSFAVGEAWLGKAAGAKRSLSITLGTGFGSAFIEDGIPVVERDDVPGMGNLWHVPFNGEIADASFSVRWFINRYTALSGSRLANVKQIAAKAAESDAHAKEVFTEFGVNLGTFLAPWLKRFAADVLVIGGNIAAAYAEFGPALEATLRKHHISVAIHLSELKEQAALIGSARLFEDKFWAKVQPLLTPLRPLP